ncbi:Cytochrome P450 76A2 [Vitis vinifera]|uniref:Cytochrome P450 76A2 n=1 Tax=Vitis vinifera TaxID=29760 RepID=A0A438JSG6_VITVI|nr:Cytochrome P450 76A2 [Vitis vinifera]
MELSTASIVFWSCFFSAALLLFLRLIKFTKGSTKSTPPGPQGWPIFGNIFDLGTLPHQTLYRLRPQHGPVLWLQLGAINTMVVQSAKAAAELFKNHDLSFSDRNVPFTLTAHNYDQGSMALGKYGPYWRMIRKVCASELLVNKRINEMGSLRRKCVDDMIRWIEEDAAKSGAEGRAGKWNCPTSYFAWHSTLSATSRWRPNIADFFPLLKRLDPLGMMRNMVRDMGQALNLIARFVKERDEERQSGMVREKRDFLDVLLECRDDEKEGPHEMSDNKVKIIVLEMFFAGSDTTSSTLEWAMTELLRRPESMRKAQEELDRVVGPHGKVEESDIDQLLYLQAVVKETLRLHPPIPLLLPRNALQDTNFMGYFVPKNTQVFVNAWAIGRDPDAWKEPLSFKPDRFLGSNLDYKGQNFEFIPFGSGRRICIGISLANKLLPLALASLLHCFDWELGGGVTPETIDMNERVGMAWKGINEKDDVLEHKMIYRSTD